MKSKFEYKDNRSIGEKTKNFAQSILFWRGRKKGMIHTRNIELDDFRYIFFPNKLEKWGYFGITFYKEDSKYYRALYPLVLAMDYEAKPKWCPRWFLRFLHVFGSDRSVVRVRNRTLSNLHRKLTRGIQFWDWKTKWESYDLRISIHAPEHIQDLANDIERGFYSRGRQNELVEKIKAIDPTAGIIWGSIERLEKQLDELENSLKKNKVMKITLISDTHTKHRYCEADLPGGDLLIHAGDFMNSGYHKDDVIEFLEWFSSIKGYDKKVFIAGNHDRIIENDPTWSLLTIKDYPNLIYLQDEGFALYNMDKDSSTRIYGSPWQPEFCNWAFNLPRNSEEMKQRWDSIPEDTDILITHGPPFGHLDVPGIGKSIRVGCEMLRYRVDEILPKIHVFGHIHGSAGYYFNGHTHFINASILDERYNYTNLPISFEWDKITNEIKWS